MRAASDGDGFCRFLAAQPRGGPSFEGASIRHDYELEFPDGFRQRWRVVARASANTPPDQIPVILQNLLIDGFQLRFHRETRETQAYVLIPAKGGTK
ncbi:MAG TPA: TIGR03435 family protein [Bryobacteraceae bacterium]|nr:TIGR03435 family protein [Bryobacteraceae bacterium]